MSKKAIGLSEEGILIGFYTDAGAAPATATLAAFGKTYKDTAILETTEGEPVTCDCEESDDPEESDVIPGKTTLKYSTSDLDPESCKRVFGGVVTAGKWVAPSKFAARTVAVKFTTASGKVVEITKGKLTTRINWAIKKNGYGLLEHTITKLAGEFSIAEAAVAPKSPA
ncbi:MAG: hypothetical protein RR921_02375 [Mucinivorans sp.]